MDEDDDQRPSRDDRAQDALAGFQRAALEFIGAMRALLDVAEEAVREPGGVANIVAETIAGATAAAGGMRGPARDEPDAGVEHIRLS